METVSCDLCGSNESKVLYEKNEHWVGMGSWVIRDAQNQIVHGTNVYCENCGLVYINPRMSQDELAKFYRDDYRKTVKRDKSDTDITDRDLSVGVYNALFAKQFVEKYVEVKPGDKALDVGCHSGALMAQLRGLGFEAHGIEPDAVASSYPKRFYDLENVHNSTIENYNDEFGQCDLITICDCLEHVTSVTSVLTKLRNMLKPGGHLMIAVPAWEYPSVSVCAFLSSAHTYTFSPATMKGYLHKTGFQTVGIEFLGHAKTMMVMARVAEPKEDFLPTEVESFWQVKCYLEKYQDMINHFKYAEHLVADNKLDPKDQKVVSLFRILLSYLSHDQWFPSYASLRLSRIYRRLNHFDKELELLLKAAESQDVEDNSCGQFDVFLRLADIAIPDKAKARGYLDQAIIHGVRYEEAVWPNHDNPLAAFLAAFPNYNRYHELRNFTAEASAASSA